MISTMHAATFNKGPGAVPTLGRKSELLLLVLYEAGVEKSVFTTGVVLVPRRFSNVY